MDRVGIDLTSSYSDGDKKSKLDESKQGESFVCYERVHEINTFVKCMYLFTMV